MVDKPYGKRVWRSLPPMGRTRALEQALGFVAAMDAADHAAGED